MAKAKELTTTRSRRMRPAQPPETTLIDIELGDYVTGKDLNGELIEGFVTKIGVKYLILDDDKRRAVTKDSTRLRSKSHPETNNGIRPGDIVRLLPVKLTPKKHWGKEAKVLRVMNPGVVSARIRGEEGTGAFSVGEIELVGTQQDVEPPELDAGDASPPAETRMDRWKRKRAVDAAIASVTPTEVIPTDPSARLTQLEGDIDEGLALIEQGKARIWMAVSAIQQEELWKLPDPTRGRPNGYDTFEDYGKTRWGWERSNTFEVAAAGEVIGQLQQSGVPDSQLPTSVSQVRELKKLPPEQRPTVLQKAHEATDGKPTAAAIRAAAQPEPVVTGRDLVQSLQVAVEKHNDRVAHYGADVAPETAAALSSVGLAPCKPSITPEEFNREMQKAGLLPAAKSPESSADGQRNYPEPPEYFAPPGCLKTRTVEGGQEVFGLVLSDERMVKLAKLAEKLDWRKRRLSDAIFYLIDNYQLEE